MTPATPRIRIESLIKVYGADRRAAVEMVNRGASRSEVSHATGQLVAISRVSLSVNQGEILVLIGGSGSGKSTLIRSINGLIPPDSGNVYIDDEDIFRAGPERLRQLRLSTVSMVFQHVGLFPHRTVIENVEYGLKLQGKSLVQRRERALELLVNVGLERWADHKPSSLSGGMKQRVGLARALATGAGILLMDEPFSALDPVTRRDMRDEMRKIRTDQRTIVFVTHDMNEALELGDRIAVLRDGTLVQLGRPDELVSQPADDHVRALIHGADLALVLQVRLIARDAPVLKPGEDLGSITLQALKRMNRQRIFVLGPLGEPLGFVSREQFDPLDQLTAADAIRLMTRSFRKVTTTTPIGNLARANTYGDIWAVVDETGRFQGEVDLRLQEAGLRGMSACATA